MQPGVRAAIDLLGQLASPTRRRNRCSRPGGLDALGVLLRRSEGPATPVALSLAGGNLLRDGRRRLWDLLEVRH
eukprot:9843699-Heterocapsa_arctica.AAC.1